MLATKIFRGFVFVLMSSFCTFQHEEMNSLKLLCYIKNSADADRIKSLKGGDFVFTSSFEFVCQKEKKEIDNTKDCIIFEFENIHFLNKNSYKSILKIEDFSFYKEGTEFLIPPFVKFAVK